MCFLASVFLFFSDQLALPERSVWTKFALLSIE
jgi:hypothetical protein